MTATSARELEILVTKIQRQLAPNADVTHNVYLNGRLSGRKRQIDVLVRERIAQYEILIVIDCKDYFCPVDVKGVEEFHGLLVDVGAQKGVLVCPKGFSQAARTRAEGLQIALYRPADTNTHKWQIKATVPTIFESIEASVQVKMSTAASVRFSLPYNFQHESMIYDKNGNELGTTASTALSRWNEGRYPTDNGRHEDLSIFDVDETLIDNGFGMRIPVKLSAIIHVSSHLYFGKYPVERLSGFRDEFSGKVITNAFDFKIIEPEEIENSWLKIESERDAPMEPFLRMRGLKGWMPD